MQCSIHRFPSDLIEKTSHFANDIIIPLVRCRFRSMEMFKFDWIFYDIVMVYVAPNLHRGQFPMRSNRNHYIITISPNAWMKRQGILANTVTFHWLMMHRTNISIACEQQINSNIGNIYQIIYGLHTKRRTKSCTRTHFLYCSHTHTQAHCCATLILDSLFTSTLLRYHAIPFISFNTEN